MENANIAVAVAALMGQHTKPEIVALARRAGFRGDDARQSKEALCEFIVRANAGLPQPSVPVVPEPVEATGYPSAETAPQVPQAAVQPSPVKQGQGDAIGAAVAQALAGVLSSFKLGVDEDAVNAIIDLRLQAIQPARIVLYGDKPVSTSQDHTHPLYEKILRLVRAGVNVMLTGPAGCGKSYLAKQVARDLNREFGTIHCSAGVSESQVTGWLLPVGENGSFKFVPSHFAMLYTAGNSVFLIDEIDAADPNMLTVLNGALANGALHIPQCPDRPEWKRGADAAIIAAANTYGTGADVMYAGRNQLDAATLDRFYVVAMDYDAALEHALAGLPYTPGKAWSAAPAPTPQELADIGAWCLSLRERASTAKLRRIVSTRTMQKAIAARGAGVPWREVKADILAGWSREELSKVGE